MAIIGYTKQKELEKQIKDRLTKVFDQQPMDQAKSTKDKIDQATTNIINIFEMFLVKCFV